PAHLGQDRRRRRGRAAGHRRPGAAAAGRARRARPRAHPRQLVRPVPRRGRVRARRRRQVRAAPAGAGDGAGDDVRGRGARRLLARDAGRAGARGRRRRLRDHRPQGRLPAARRRHADAGPGRGGGAAARLPGREADGVRRPLSDRLRPVPGAARRPREAEAERRRAELRAGDVARARIRLPLRLPGPLHMDIVRERLEREHDLDLLVTAPNVAYRVRAVDGEWIEVHNPAQMPDAGSIEETEEPYVRASIICPSDHVGAVMELNQERRGTFGHMEYLSPERVQLIYDLPLAEIVLDYYDQLKSRTRGYASFDYELLGFRPGQVVKVDVLLAGERVDSLSLITHRDNAYRQGKALVEALRERIPRQMFEVAIQAAIGSRVIARETVKAKRKDVLAKCYGGDISRKRKLLEKQKKGKRRMKQVGNIEVPQEAFLAVLEINREGAA